MSENTPPEKKGQTIALLGLAASKPAVAEKCPSDEEMAAFIDNRLEGDRRQSMLNHLNRCTSCYHHWLEVASYLSTAGAETPDREPVSVKMQTTMEAVASYPAAEEQPPKIKDIPPSFSETKARRWLTYLGQWQVALPATLAIAMLAFIILSPMPADIDVQISESYVKVIRADGANLSTIARNLPVPWDKAALGFSVPERTMAARAFGAGVWFGQKTLLQTEPMPFPEGLSSPDGVSWKASKWRNFYSFGRWAVFLWVLAQSEQAAADWDVYTEVSRGLRSDLSKHPVDEVAAQEAIAAVDRIEPLLAEVNRQRDSRSFATLSRKLLMIMERLAPGSL